MKKLLFALLAFSLPLLSRAQLLLFTTTLSGSQETPPIATPAFGFGTASLDVATRLFEFDFTYSGLLTDGIVAHIHSPGLPGVTAPVLFTFTAFDGFVAGQTSGSISYSGTLTTLQAAALQAGQFYVDVHTAPLPGGEIRGQLVQVFSVPEASTFGYAGGAILACLVALRRRRFAA